MFGPEYSHRKQNILTKQITFRIYEYKLQHILCMNICLMYVCVYLFILSFPSLSLSFPSLSLFFLSLFSLSYLSHSLCIYIYIYIQRVRERKERERVREREKRERERVKKLRERDFKLAQNELHW